MSPFAIPLGRKPAPVASELEEPPGDLPVDQRAFWLENAPLAVERRTLVPATVTAFRLLCELHAKKVLVAKKIDEGDLGGLRIFAQLAKQVENLMGRFCLAPFGKPIEGAKPKATENPWAAVK